DSRAQRHIELAAVDAQRLPELALEETHHPGGVVERVDVLQKHRELVAPHPGDRPLHARPDLPLLDLRFVPRAREHLFEAFLESSGDQLEHAIPDQVTEAIVDVLELVDVQEDDGQTFFGPPLAGATERMSQAIEE